MKYHSDWHISHVDAGIDRASVIFTSGYGPTVTVFRRCCRKLQGVVYVL
jgi:hypothetical protein